MNGKLLEMSGEFTDDIDALKRKLQVMRSIGSSDEVMCRELDKMMRALDVVGSVVRTAVSDAVVRSGSDE